MPVFSSDVLVSDIQSSWQDQHIEVVLRIPKNDAKKIVDDCKNVSLSDTRSAIIALQGLLSKNKVENEMMAGLSPKSLCVKKYEKAHVKWSLRIVDDYVLFSYRS